jgi:hypothetical protein
MPFKFPFKIPSDAPQTSAPREDWERDRLLRLLPAVDAPYDCRVLSKAEAEALTEAPNDGFNIYLGEAIDTRRVRLPTSFVNSKLLTHFFYSRKSINNLTLEKSVNKFPLTLNEDLLQIYFQNQFERFRHHFRSEIDLSSDDIKVVSEWQYQKPWYESHALSRLKEIQSLKESTNSEIVNTTDAAKRLSIKPYEIIAEELTSELIFVAGQLGRLVEQYSWRFKFEGAATAGITAQQGASAGGKAKAKVHQAEHSLWQSEALKIWATNPDFSANAVAIRVRKRLSVTRTAKHIARYISPPVKN